MSESTDRRSLTRLAAYAVAALLAVIVMLRVVHQKNAASAAIADTAASAPTAIEPPPIKLHRPNENEILAGCHPHLGPHSTVIPSIDVSRIGNPAGAIFKVVFWVNGNGFVIQSYVNGFTIYSPADQAAALDYINTLTFQVPNTPECSTRKIELNGKFIQTRNSSGEWETILDVYPRYSFNGTQVVQNR